MGCNESILFSVKQAVGASEFGTAFDGPIINHINTVFFDLCQLGVGPKTPFYITDGDTKWEDFTKDVSKFLMVKSYIELKVRMLFDPPTSGILRDALNKEIDEMEWRLNVQAETPCEEVVEGGEDNAE